MFENVNIETGYDTSLQLYNLKDDIGKKINRTTENKAIVKELTDLLNQIKNN